MKFGAPDRYSPEARAFVSTHHPTEAEHLAYFDRLLDMRMKSKLFFPFPFSHTHTNPHTHTHNNA